MLYIANWKMQLTYNQTIAWLEKNRQALNKLAHDSRSTIVICPSTESLAATAHALKHESIFWGAQDCSTHESGSYTGQISAKSLVELQCTYCIIGHSECYKYMHETLEDTRKKLMQATAVGLIPILCIGEHEKEKDLEKVKNILIEQLNFLLQNSEKAIKKLVIIAYEPWWAIGADEIPEKAALESISALIRQETKKLAPQASIFLVYGGSVDQNNASQLKKYGFFDGFLIGRASLDFQIFEKIVL